MYYINVTRILYILTILLETVNTDTFVKYNAMKTLLKYARSVSINGKTIILNEWLAREFNDDDEQNYENLKIMNTFIQCECARTIKLFLEPIYNSMQQKNSNELNSTSYDRERDAIPNLKKLNEEIKLAITTLFEISDKFPNLKFVEPYFLKSLLMTSFYIDSLNQAVLKEEGNSIDDAINAVIRELDTLSASTSAAFFIKKEDYERLKEDRVKIEMSEILPNMQRVLLQIMNLIDQYIIVYCHSKSDSNNENTNLLENVNSSLESHLSDFHNILTTVIPMDTHSPLYTMINMDKLKLKDCLIQQKTEGDDSFNFCVSFIQKSEIKTSSMDRYIFLAHLFSIVEYSFDIEYVYDYVFKVYQAILKIIYQETKVYFENEQLIDSADCINIIKKLKSMNCPIEMIDHFEFILKTIKHHSDDTLSRDTIKTVAIDILANKKDKISIVNISNQRPTNMISLQNLMDYILGIEFKQFWWFFNFLYRESEKKSYRVYDFTLTLFPDKVIMLSDNKDKIKCNALTKIYQNWFYIERMNKKCLSGSNPNFGQCFSDINDRNTSFSSYLLADVEKWHTIDHLKKDKDLFNIFLAAIIHLKNEFNNKIGIENNNESNDLIIITLRKQEKLTLIGDVIMNMLDNYQIRYCEFPKLRKVVYNDNTETTIVTIQKINISGEDTSTPSDTNDQIIISDIITALGDSDRVRVPEEFYKFSQLTGIDDKQNFELLAKEIYYNWHGEIKSIHEIKIDISENMLDIHDLVEYQILFVKWIIYMYFYSWLVIFNAIVDSNTDDSFRSSEFINAFNNINHFYLNIELLKPFDEYKHYTEYKYHYSCTVFNGTYRKDFIQMAKDEIKDPMTVILGVTSENVITITDIKRGFEMDEIGDTDTSTLYSTLFSFLQEIIRSTEESFIFNKYD